MKKFEDYLKDINKYRELKVGLVKKSTDSELIQQIRDDFDLGVDLIKLREDLNSELNKNYTGKFKFDFCLIEDINLERLKVKNRDEFINRLKKKVFEVSDSLAKSQTKIERDVYDKNKNR